MARIPRALTIAGSDCSGGAGIQADLKTFHRFGVFGTCAVTAVVAENTMGVQGVQSLSPEFVARQIDSVLEDIGTDALKTGMLVDAAVIRAVASSLRRHGAERLVVDPVMRAKGGDPLIDPEAVETLIREIFPLAAVVTPNVSEAEALSGLFLDRLEDFREAAVRIRKMGPEVVVLKGGHSRINPEGASLDFVWDGENWTTLQGPRSPDRNTHGTGCTFSAAITANLARGLPVMEALRRAKTFIGEAIASAPNLGSGYGPVNHWAPEVPE